jgi:hypothetical protein
MQLRRLHLEAALAGPRVEGEDVEDHLGAVDDLDAELLLEVALLARAEVLVADQGLEPELAPALAKLLDLAAADEERGLDLLTALDVRANDGGAVGAAELRELAHLLVELLGGSAGELNTDQEGALLGRRRVD